MENGDPGELHQLRLGLNYCNGSASFWLLQWTMENPLPYLLPGLWAQGPGMRDTTSVIGRRWRYLMRNGALKYVQ